MSKVTDQAIRRALKMTGLPVVKIQRVSFQDLARGEAYFVTFSEAGNYTAQLRQISTEMGISVLQQP